MYWMDTNAGADIIDIRDVIAQVENLRASLEVDEYPDERAELTVLESLLSDLAGLGGDEQWEGEWYPLTLIRDDETFAQYAQQLAEDCGMIDSDAAWPTRHIDWEAAADELRQDYSEVTYGGTDYLYR